MTVNCWRILKAGLISAMLGMVFIFTTFPARAQDCENEQTLQKGARLYAENCALCHGEEGQGRVGATLSKNWPSIRPDLRVRETITNGVPGSPMPAWSTVNGGPFSEGEIDSLVCFILSWESGGPPLIYPTPTFKLAAEITAPPGVEGDPNAGAVLYQANCVVCHGEKGEGRIGANLSRVFSSIRPDLLTQSVIAKGVEGSAMPAWSQDNGGPLTNDQIRDIVAYILTWVPAPGVVATAPPIPEAAGLPWWAWVLVFLAFICVIVIVVLVSRRAQQNR